VEAFGQSASLDDLYASFGIDVNGVIRAVEQATEGKPIRHRKGFASA
jgi:pyruvate dehydrogenase complex dehydrogenase (E1) component